MKTAHDLVAAAKTRVQETTIADADQAIREADLLLENRLRKGAFSGALPCAWIGFNAIN